MKKGIFDPWRQVAPKPPPTPQEQAKIDPDKVLDTEHCVQFKGLKGGISVWIWGEESDKSVELAQIALLELVEALTRLPGASEVFDRHRVFYGATRDGAVNLSRFGKSLAIVPPLAEQSMARAVDALTRALRDVSIIGSTAARLMAQKRIKTYVT